MIRHYTIFNDIYHYKSIIIKLILYLFEKSEENL